MTTRDLLMKYENQWIFLSKEQIEYMLMEAGINEYVDDDFKKQQSCDQTLLDKIESWNDGGCSTGLNEN